MTHGAARGRRARADRLERSLGIVVFVVMVFPVFWMISTAFKPDDEIISLNADLVPAATRRSSTSATRSTSRTSGTTSRTA